MKMRQSRKQFWWTWHHCTSKHTQYSRTYGWFDWGVGRIRHQLKDRDRHGSNSST